MSDLGLPEKRCRDCGQVKPAAEFWRRKQSPDGLALYCRECFGLRNAANYRKTQAAIGKETRVYRRHSAVPDGMKYCARCGEIKPIDDFGSNRAEPSGRASYCRPCHNRAMAEIRAKKHGSVRGYHPKRRYGLTEEEVAALFDGQGGFCLICLHRHSGHVDHDHTSGEIRGAAKAQEPARDVLDRPPQHPGIVTQLPHAGVAVRAENPPNGGHEVAVVRPRRAVVDPGWDIGQIGGHDLAVIQALASGGGEDPWETDVGVAPDEVTELRFPALDLTDPAAGGPVPAEPPDPAEYAVT